MATPLNICCELLSSYYSTTDRRLNFVCIQPWHSVNTLYMVSHTMDVTDTPDFYLCDENYNKLKLLIGHTINITLFDDVEVFEMCKCTVQALRTYVNSEARKVFIDEILADLA